MALTKHQVGDRILDELAGGRVERTVYELWTAIGPMETSMETVREAVKDLVSGRKVFGRRTRADRTFLSSDGVTLRTTSFAVTYYFAPVGGRSVVEPPPPRPQTRPNR